MSGARPTTKRTRTRVFAFATTVVAGAAAVAGALYLSMPQAADIIWSFVADR